MNQMRHKLSHNKTHKSIPQLINGVKSLIYQNGIAYEIVTEIESNNSELALDLLSKNINLLSNTNSAYLILSCAIQFRNDAILKLLIKNGVDIENTKFGTNISLLNLKIANCDKPAVQFLIENGCSYKIDDVFFDTLSFLDNMNNFQMMEFVVESAISHAKSNNEIREILLGLSTRNKTNTLSFIIKNHDLRSVRKNCADLLLIIAAKHNFPELANELISKKANLDFMDDRGNNPLLTSARYGTTEISRILINAGADVNVRNRNGDTALIIALNNGFIELAILLIESTNNIDAQNNFGYTALMTAANEGYVEIVNLLLEKGANVDIQSYEEGYTTLMWAIQNDNYKVAEKIIKYKPNLELTDSRGRSALLIAFGNENINIIDLLIKSGAEIYSIPFNALIQKDKNEQFSSDLPNYRTEGLRPTEITMPALAICTVTRKKNIIEHFIDYGINIDAIDSHGSTSLIWASISDNLDIVSLLLDSGADINIQNHNGETALIYGAINENIEIVTLLLKNGANVDLRDRNGFAAVDRTTNTVIKKILYAHSSLGNST